VLFMVFNRPDTTTQVFEAIREARPRRLYVAADGPRSGRALEPERCAEARRITEAVDWPCEVRRLYRDENLGCKRAISSAITWFFEHEEAGIILEDDCLPDPSFFPYCQMMLERYKDEPRVSMISGDDYTRGQRLTRDSYYFTTYFPIWGWATWRRAWAKYDITMATWPEARDSGLVRRRIAHRGLARWFEECFEKTYQGEIDTWDFQWAFTNLREGGVALCPHGNLISNIGYVGTHMNKAPSKDSLLGLPQERFDLASVKHPSSIAAKASVDKAVHQAVMRDNYGGSTAGRLDAFVWRVWKKVRGEAKS